ncbi:hypothetical protein ACJX0J_040436 [Zea mays]
MLSILVRVHLHFTLHCEKHIQTYLKNIPTCVKPCLVEFANSVFLPFESCLYGLQVVLKGMIIGLLYPNTTIFLLFFLSTFSLYFSLTSSIPTCVKPYVEIHAISFLHIVVYGMMQEETHGKLWVSGAFAKAFTTIFLLFFLSTFSHNFVLLLINVIMKMT